MKEKQRALLGLVPEPPGWKISWDDIENSALQGLIGQMKSTLQNPLWHGEGDVWTHTRMVCEELINIPDYCALDRRRQQIVFIAALLHDIGKIPCTRLEDGEWVSPNHTLIGSKMAREFLWTQYDLCGSTELQQFRETVCTLIRYHSVPPHVLDQKDPAHRLVKIASDSELILDFSVELLCLLEEADVKGRVAQSKAESLELIELCREQAKEIGCYRSPAGFPDSFSEYAYLAGRNVALGQEIYDDTWGEVILMAGLPASGKDTWIKKHYSHYPMISLDEIRRERKISPTDDQGIVIGAAREQAKEYLRKKQVFVWNATNLTPQIRQKQVDLFESYHASVRIVFLEAQWEEQLKRNRERKAEVPEGIICKMLGNMILPERFEAAQVEWNCV